MSHDRPGVCPRCGEHVEWLHSHVWRNKDRAYCGERKPRSNGPTFDEVAERFPSVRYGQEQWYQLLRMDNGIFDAILRDMTKQALKHPIEEQYGPTRDDRSDHWHLPEEETG